MASSSSTMTMSGWSSCMGTTSRRRVRIRGPSCDEAHAGIGVTLHGDGPAVRNDDRSRECEPPSFDYRGLRPETKVRDGHLDHVLGLPHAQANRLVVARA